MNTIEAIMSRRTAHFYEDRPVADEHVRAALEAATRAPNHKLTNPWRFTAIGSSARAQLVELALSLKSQKRELSESERARIRDKVGGAPVLIAFSQVLADDEFRRREDYASVACAIQNYCLAMWDAGVSTKWSTGGWTSAVQTYEIMGVDPEREDIVGVVMAGYPRDTNDPPRRPLEEVYRVVD